MDSAAPERKEVQQPSLTELETALQTCKADKEEAERRAEKSEKAAREMEVFAYAVAHDLKAPLRTMASFTQLLTRRLPDDPDIREYAGHIISGAGEMQAVIDGVQRLWDISKPHGRTNIRLDVILQLALLGLQTQLKTAGGEVKFDPLPEVEINESQFVQLFEHLIRNSILYRGSEAPTIRISSEKTDDWFTISVRDNGAGIDPRYNEDVFKPLKRLHGKDYPGVGLGLTISRRIVEAHGGRMWVESDGRTGSNFLFTLPAQ